jgi:hypothetical protein
MTVERRAGYIKLENPKMMILEGRVQKIENTKKMSPAAKAGTSIIEQNINPALA